MAETVILAEDVVEFKKGSNTLIKLHNTDVIGTLSIKIGVAENTKLSISSGSMNFHTTTVVDAGNFFFSGQDRFLYWPNTNNSEFHSIQGPTGDTGDTRVSLCLPRTTAGAVGDILGVESLDHSDTTVQLGWISGSGFVKTTTNEDVSGIKTFRDGIKLNDRHATNWTMLDVVNPTEKSTIFFPVDTAVANDILMVESVTTAGGVNSYQMKYENLDSTYWTASTEQLSLSGNKSTSGTFQITDTTNSNFEGVGALSVRFGGLYVHRKLYCAATIEAVSSVKTPLLHWNYHTLTLDSTPNTVDGKLLTHSGSATGTNCSWTGPYLAKPDSSPEYNPTLGSIAWYTTFTKNQDRSQYFGFHIPYCDGFAGITNPNTGVALTTGDLKTAMDSSASHAVEIIYNCTFEDQTYWHWRAANSGTRITGPTSGRNFLPGPYGLLRGNRRNPSRFTLYYEQNNGDVYVGGYQKDSPGYFRGWIQANNGRRVEEQAIGPITINTLGFPKRSAGTYMCSLDAGSSQAKTVMGTWASTYSTVVFTEQTVASTGVGGAAYTITISNEGTSGSGSNDGMLTPTFTTSGTGGLTATFLCAYRSVSFPYEFN